VETKPEENTPENNINDKVIAIQRADGIDVGTAWWERSVTAVVGNGASQQQMLEAFMTAYNRDFPKDSNGQRHPLANTESEPS
jgi:hypothetical protein